MVSENKLSNDFIIYMIRTIIVSLGPIITFPYATRILGAVGIGRVQYIQSIASYFQLIATFGITSYGIRECAKIRDNSVLLGKLVSELIILNIITTSISLVLYCFTFKISNLQDYKSLLLLFSFYVVFYGMNLDWVYNVLQDYTFITIRTAFSYLLSIAVMFLFLRNRDDELVYAIVIIIPYMGNFVWNFYGIRKRIHLFSGYTLQIRKHIRPCVLLFSIIISSSIYSLLDTTMLGVMMNDEAVGLYTAASKLTKLVGQLTTAMCAVFAPRLSYHVGKGNRKEFRELAKKASNVITMVSIPCAIGLMMFAYQAIEIFSGKEFVQASFAMRILSINLIFSTLDYLLGWQILVPNNKDRILFLATVVGAISDFIFNLLLVPRFGVEGAAVATMLAEMSVFLICIINSRVYMNMRVLTSHCLKCLLASLPIIFIGMWLRNFSFSSAIQFLIAIPLSAVAYIAILCILKDQEVLNILMILRKKISKN